ncbi:hypothetical protein P7C73_g6434, partial [Tremellales sp. Uapishka_1]
MTSPAEQTVLYDSNLSTRIYKLNRPKARNALNQEMILSLKEKIKTWRESELCKVIIGTGEGVAFCAGGDVKAIVQGRKAGKDGGLQFFKDEFELNWSLARLGKPYVAVMDGITMGGGAGLALPAPLRIATSKSIFAMPETKIGYAPDVGASYYLSQLDGAIGAWLAVTGQEVFGRAVYELGIATHYVDPSSLPSLLDQISQLSSPSTSTLSTIISSYHPSSSSSSNLASSSKSSPEGPSPITGAIRDFLDKTFSLKSIKEIYDALGKTETEATEVQEWAKAQRDLMDLRSPTGMAVALEGSVKARKAERLDFVLSNDVRMATGFAGPDRPTDDFTIGVTSLLIDKSSDKPSWSPSSLSDPSLSPKAISDAFFASNENTPRLSFDPKPTSSRGSDSTWGHFRKFGLPSEMEVKAVVQGSAPGSGAFKVTEEEVVVDKLSDRQGETGGARETEVKDRVRAIVGRWCEKDGEGYLSWKKE